MKMKKYKNTKKQGIFIDRTKRTAGIWLGAAIVFMAAAVFGFGRAAATSQQGRLAESRLRYEKQEEAYVERARKVLDEAGLNKAGVMLEYRQGADQTRSYTLYRFIYITKDGKSLEKKREEGWKESWRAVRLKEKTVIFPAVFRGDGYLTD